MAKPSVTSEAELCAAFIEQFNVLDGWTCYPETAGFDILVVHDDGRQIGVEARLKLNAKVADQILPGHWELQYASAGPDHRMVIVGDITEASHGIARLLEMCGVAVLKPDMRSRYVGTRFDSVYFPDFGLKDWMRQGQPWRPHLFDWNPPERCKVPIVVPDVPAGVPAPLRFTPWKEAALRVLIQLRRQGCITVKEIAAHGISPTVWTRGERAWLRKGEAAGKWVETEHLPAFDKQHPEAYAKLLELEKWKDRSSVAVAAKKPRTAPASAALRRRGLERRLAKTTRRRTIARRPIHRTAPNTHRE